MKKFKIKNRPKRKYTKKTFQAAQLKTNTHEPIKIFDPVLHVPSAIIQPTLTASIQKQEVHNTPKNKIKTKTLLLYIMSILLLCSTFLNPYISIGYLYSKTQIIIGQAAISTHSITTENNKIIYKIIFTIIYTIDLTNKWLISQIILFLSATGHTIIYYWEKLTSLISSNLTQASRELDTLSPPIKFVLNNLHDSAQTIFSNMHNIFKFIETKTITSNN